MAGSKPNSSHVNTLLLVIIFGWIFSYTEYSFVSGSSSFFFPIPSWSPALGAADAKNGEYAWWWGDVQVSVSSLAASQLASFALSDPPVDKALEVVGGDDGMSVCGKVGKILSGVWFCLCVYPAG